LRNYRTLNDDLELIRRYDEQFGDGDCDGDDIEFNVDFIKKKETKG
jgi:hypothetical protein